MPRRKTKKQELQSEQDALVSKALKWTAAQVVEFICDLGFPQYELCFRENFISGRQLVFMDMSTLPEIGITDFEHMKTICHAIDDLLGIDRLTSDRSVGWPRRDPMALYLETKTRTGERINALAFSAFVEKYANQLHT